MTSFSWKRKSGLSSSAATAFTEDDDEGSSEVGGGVEDDVDWLSAAKRRRTILLEDSAAKSERLLKEGVILAENERYWEAIKHWDEALQLTPHSAVLYEMKSQAFMELGEVFPAVEAAEMAVKLDSTWAIARQTLGRAQLGFGEVELSLKSFEKALHLDPSNQEIRDEDLKWAQELVRRKEAMKAELESAETKGREDILQKLRKGKQENTNHSEMEL